MNLHEELARLSQYSSLDRLVEATKGPVRYCPEPFTHLLPSISMGRDGPTLDSIVLVSENYLCDVRLAGQSFDFVAKNNIQNYRLDFSSHTIYREGEVPKVYEIAWVVLRHGNIDAKFQTQLSYVGDDRDRWLDTVFDAIPLAVVAGV